MYVMQTDYNATKAARGAGYTLLNSAQAGYELLRNPEIQARIAELMADEAELFDMSADEAKAETAALARFDLADLYDEDGQLIPIHELPRHVSICITEIEYDKLRLGIPVKVKAGKDKMAAIDKVHRIHGSYEADNKGQGEIHIHLDEKDMKA